MRLTVARFVLAAVAVLAASLGAASLRAMAEGPLYPDRPLTMVVTFTAGDSSDVLARAVADAMSRGFGKQVAVDNGPAAMSAPSRWRIRHRTAIRYCLGPTVHSASGPRFIRICDTIPSAISRRSESLHELPLLLINGYEGLKRFEMTEMASWLLREHCRRDRGSTGATPTNVQPSAFAVLITRSKLIVRQR